MRHSRACISAICRPTACLRATDCARSFSTTSSCSFSLLRQVSITAASTKSDDLSTKPVDTSPAQTNTATQPNNFNRREVNANCEGSPLLLISISCMHFWLSKNRLQNSKIASMCKFCRIEADLLRSGRWVSSSPLTVKDQIHLRQMVKE